MTFDCEKRFLSEYPYHLNTVYEFNSHTIEIKTIAGEQSHERRPHAEGVADGIRQVESGTGAADWVPG